MKRVTLAAAALAACLAAAQSPAPATAPAMPSAAAESGDNMAELRKQVRADRRGLIERNLQLTPKEAEKFWPVYDKYQRDLEKILRRQNRAINDYVAAEDSMTNANAKRIAREILATEADEQSLKEKTMKSVVKVLPEKKAVRFLQLENKIRIVQRYDLAAVMPLVR
jgi:Spy/CpxP family protein refolding chaperone